MLLIQNAKVLTMAEKNYDKGDILVDDNGKIAAVGENLSAPQGAEVLDANGLWALPGFVDAHCHLGMFEECMGTEGEDGNEMTDPVTPTMRAIDGINPVDIGFKEALEAGVTTACTGPGSGNVIGGQFVAMKTAGSQVDHMIFRDPLAMKAAFGENPKRVYGSGKKVTPMTRMATAAIMRQAFVDAQNYQKKLEEGQKDASKLPEYNPRMEVLVKVLRRELVMKLHAHRADDILTAIRIMKEFDLRYTLEHCTEGHLIVETLKEENAQVILGPLLTARSKIELENLTYDAPRIFYEHGMKFAMMTDHPVIPEKYLPVCAALAVRSGLPQEAALKSITIWAAEITGIDDRVGSLEVGKDADIALFEGDPLDARTRAARVYVNGVCAYQRA